MSRHGAGALERGMLGPQRQADRKCAATAHLGGHGDLAAVGHDDSIAYREAEPEPSATFLGSVDGSKMRSRSAGSMPQP